MQWRNAPQAGFTEGLTTWLQVNPNYKSINVEAQQNDPGSVLNYYKKLLRLRKQTPALIDGEYVDLRPRCNRIWAYLRQNTDRSLLIINNFTREAQRYEIPNAFVNAPCLIGNYADIPAISERIVLRPFEALVVAHASLNKV
jgi:glycosidase